MAFSRALAFSVAAASVLMIHAAEGRAQTSVRVGAIQYQSAFGQGFATDQEVARVLGRLSFSITDCGHIGLGSIARGVRVVAEKSEYDDAPVVETVLRRAVEFAWRTCPLRFIFGVNETSEIRLNVGSVELYLPSGMLAIRAESFTGDNTFHPGSSYSWQSVENVGARQRALEAAAVAEWTRQAQQQLVMQQRRAESQAASASFRDTIQDIWGTIQKLLIFIAVVVVVGVLLGHRGTIVRWYYFAFHPHPAEPLIRSALERGHPLDGKALAAALVEMPPDSRLLREVRIEQGERLVAQMRRASERAIARATADYERAAFVGIQEAIALAAVALERAKAAHEASKSVRGRAA